MIILIFFSKQIYYAELDPGTKTIHYYICKFWQEVKKELLVSFSQNYEDIALYHLLSKVKSPIRYIDVGANHPIIDSVTRLFYLRGGFGINIEPQPRYLALLEIDRPKDINIGIGIGSKEDSLILYGNGECATFDSTSKFVDTNIKTEVKVETLDSVIKRHNISPIHFLKIDCEGWERDCILGANLKKNRPWLICIESTLPCTNEECFDKWESLLLDANYVFVGKIGINRFYAASEYTESIEFFLNKRELDNKYFVVKNSDIISLIKEEFL